MVSNPHNMEREVGSESSLVGLPPNATSHLPSAAPVEKSTVGEFDVGLVPDAYALLERCMKQSQNPEIFKAAIRQLLADLVHSIDLKLGAAIMGATT